MKAKLKRREFVTLLGSAAAWPLAVRAEQQTTRVPRVGWLVTGSPTSYRFSLAAFRDGLKALGYVEGNNITIEYRWAEGNIARLAELASELVQQNVDVILAGGSLGAEAAKQATSIIPIVAAGVADLVDIGLVVSLARPGGNLTGFVASAPEAAAKRFEIMREIKPHTKRAVVLWNPTNSSAKLESNAAKEFAAANDLDLVLYGARTSDELSKALTEIPSSTPDCLVVLNDPFMFTHRKVIVDAAGRFRLPSIYGLREFVDDGGMISYGAASSSRYLAARRRWHGLSRRARSRASG
jgi:putative ABC transport system substrate-binding protein